MIANMADAKIELQRQADEIARLRATLAEQARTIAELTADKEMLDWLDENRNTFNWHWSDIRAAIRAAMEGKP